MSNETVKVEQANGHVCTIRLIARLLGEASCRNIEPAVTRPKTADKGSNLGCAHSALAMLDLSNNARGLEPQRIG